jgi:hypothetical protein
MLFRSPRPLHDCSIESFCAPQRGDVACPHGVVTVYSGDSYVAVDSEERSKVTAVPEGLSAQNEHADAAAATARPAASTLETRGRDMVCRALRGKRADNEAR